MKRIISGMSSPCCDRRNRQFSDWNHVSWLEDYETILSQEDFKLTVSVTDNTYNTFVFLYIMYLHTCKYTGLFQTFVEHKDDTSRSKKKLYPHIMINILFTYAYLLLYYTYLPYRVPYF